MAENKSFINDLTLVNPLILSFYRATITHGKIMNFTLPDQLPEGAYIIQAKDLPQNYIDIMGCKIPLLYENEINFHGEPIFLLVAENEKDIKFLRDNIKIEYIPSIPYTFSPPYKPEQILSPKEYEFIYEEIKYNPEDTYTVETETSGDYFKPEYPDPIGIISYQQGAFLFIQTPTSFPFHVRKCTADFLGIDEQQVKVGVTEMSSPIQGRIWYPSYMAIFSAYVTNRFNRPAKFIYKPEEVYNFTPAQYPFYVRHISTIEKKTGRLLNCEVNIDINTGAYPLFSKELIKIILSDALGKYKIPKIKISERLIKTNTVPKTFITGLSLSNVLSSVENHINSIISQLNEDPIQWRKDNIRETFPSKILDSVVEKSDFLRKFISNELLRKSKENSSPIIVSKKGIGLALGYYNNNRELEDFKNNTLSCTLRWDTNRRITINTGTVPQYFEEYDYWRKLVSNKLGLNKENIIIGNHDTFVNSPSSPDMFSNVTLDISRVIEQGCHFLVDKLAKQPLPVEVTATLDDCTPSLTGCAWGAAVMEIYMDMKTYKPIIKEIWMSVHCGEINDDKILKSNLKKQIYNTLLWLTEPLDTGYATNWKFVNIPIDIEIIKDSDIKGTFTCGDLPFWLIPSAYSSAVSQAINKDIFNYPITPESIYRTLEEK